MPKLPPDIVVIVRDWLSANHVLLTDSHESALIDSGYGTRFEETQALLRSPAALGRRRLDRLLNTHVHSDHVGGNAALKREYGCRIELPSGEAALVDAWDDRGLLLGYADQRCEPFDYDCLIEPGSELVVAGRGWRSVDAPGHDMGAVMFYCAEERILVTGDALWRNGFGFLEPDVEANGRLEATEHTLQAIASLDVDVIIPGHGEPFAEVEEALDRAYSRVEQYRREPIKMAWLALKSLFVYSLMDRRRLALADLPDYVAQVPVYRDWSNAMIKRTPQALAEQLLSELERSGAVRIQDGTVFPA